MYGKGFSLESELFERLKWDCLFVCFSVVVQYLMSCCHFTNCTDLL